MDHYAIVFFPHINTTTIEAFREKYDPMFGIISPHVTMVFPFKDLEEQAVTQHVEQVITKREPFSIHLHGFTKSFDQYLFLLIAEGKEEMYDLHDQLYTNILAPQLRTDIPFIPHLTLGFFQNEKNELKKDLYDKALREAEELNLDFHTSFDTLTLIKGDGIKPAQIIHTFEINN